MGYSFDMLAGEPGGVRRRRPPAVRNRHHKLSQAAARLERLEDRLLFNTGLDPAFGNGGRTRIDVADLAEYAAALRRLPDGKILVAGSATWGLDSQAQPLRRAFVARLTVNGGLDATFGQAGIATYPAAGADQPVVAEVTSLAVGADGRIFVGGSTTSIRNPPPAFMVPPTAQPDPQWAVAAFTAEGSADVTFGVGGVATVEVFDQPDGIFPTPETVQALAVQPDGKVVAAGALRESGAHASDVLAVRFNADGSRDTPFGAAVLELPNDDTPVPAEAALALQPDGKVVIAGRSWNDTSGSFVLGRYNADGTPDSSFGASSRAQTPVARPESAGGKGGAEGGFTALLVQPDGRIVVAGKVGYFEVALLRYSSAGALDTTFGAGGSAIARTTYVGGGDLQPGGDGAVTLAVVGVGSSAADDYVMHDADSKNDALAQSLHTWTGVVSSAGAVIAAWTTERPYAGSGFAEQYSVVAIQPDGSLLTAGVYQPAQDAGGGVSWGTSQTSDALVTRVVRTDAGITFDNGGDYLTVTPTPSSPAGDSVNPPVIITVPSPVFSGKATVTRGRFYKFDVGYTSQEVATNTSIGVYGPSGLLGAAQLVKMRNVRSNSPDTNAVRASAKYRVAAPGGKFDSGDNGAYAVRLGTAAAPPLGQQIGQFTVASKAKARPAQGSQLRRLVLPAAAASVARPASALLAGEAAEPAGEAMRAESRPLEEGKRKKFAVADRGTSRAAAVTSIRASAAP